MRAFWFWMLTLSSAQLQADTQVFNTLLECEKQPKQCIAFTDRALKSAEVLSVKWYHLKNLNLAAHWQLTHTEPLREELETLAQLRDAPAVFRITVLTIYSKLVISEGNMALGEQLVEEVTQLIRDVNAVSLSPDRYAELIVLLNAVGDLGRSALVGKRLLKVLKNSRRNVELGDFYGALGHTQFGLGNYAAAREFYQSALVSFTELQHDLEISNTLHNIARSYQAMKLYTRAIPEFEKSLQWKAKAGPASDLLNEQYTRMRFVESLFHAGQKGRAREEFAKIQLAFVLESYRPLYDEIGSLIGNPQGPQAASEGSDKP